MRPQDRSLDSTRSHIYTTDLVFPMQEAPALNEMLFHLAKPPAAVLCIFYYSLFSGNEIQMVNIVSVCLKVQGLQEAINRSTFRSLDFQGPSVFCQHN